MFIRSFTKSSRATKLAFVQPVAPLRLLARYTTSSSDSSSPTPASKVTVALGQVPLSKLPSDPNKPSAQNLTEGVYQKEHETSPEPITTLSGTRSYVVTEPDPAGSKYEIPTGAYHSTAPYKGLEAGNSSNSEVVHPVIPKRMPKQGGAVGQGASVGDVGVGSAPGQIIGKASRSGGLGLMGKAGTQE